MTALTILPCDQSVAGEFGQHLCAPCEHECIDALVQAFAAHREAEAARIVAWLRDMSKAAITPDLCCFVGDAFGDDGQWMCGNLADAIERDDYNGETK